MTKPFFKFNKFKRIIFYGISGSIGVLSDLFIFTTLAYLLPPGYFIVYNVFSYLIGTCVSFIFNSRLTFSSKISRLSFRRFLFVAFIGVLLSSLIIYACISVGFPSISSKVFATVLVVSLQFIFNTSFSVVSKSRSK